MHNETELGYGNKLHLLDDEILENLNKIQLRNGLEHSKKLISKDFTVEMETGTGKTYVYLKTIFLKFSINSSDSICICVPSLNLFPLESCRTVANNMNNGVSSI